MASLWGELRRRNVFRVAVAFAIVAWLLIEMAATVFPALKLPEWTVTFVTVLILISFPIILIGAWAFEVTPDGLKRTREVPLEHSITHATGRKFDFAIIGLLTIAVEVELAPGIFHVHIHLIPRYTGDSPRPQGGVRQVIPGKAAYPPE